MKKHIDYILPAVFILASLISAVFVIYSISRPSGGEPMKPDVSHPVLEGEFSLFDLGCASGTHYVFEFSDFSQEQAKTLSKSLEKSFSSCLLYQDMVEVDIMEELSDVYEISASNFLSSCYISAIFMVHELFSRNVQEEQMNEIGLFCKRQAVRISSMHF